MHSYLSFTGAGNKEDMFSWKIVFFFLVIFVNIHLFIGMQRFFKIDARKFHFSREVNYECKIYIKDMKKKSKLIENVISYY